MRNLVNLMRVQVNGIQLTAIGTIGTIKNHFTPNEWIVVKVKAGIVTRFVGKPYNGVVGGSVDPGFGHGLL